MRTFLLIAGLHIIGLTASAQILVVADTLSEQSVPLREWKYSFTDSPAMNLPSFNDSNWSTMDPSLAADDSISALFPGIGWFRLHFNTDTSMHDFPISIVMEHFGASEIYLDGMLVKTFGDIKGPADSKYYNPALLPFIITIPNSGSHLLAVRYANFEIKHQFDDFVGLSGGFKMTLAGTENSILQRDQNSRFLSFIMALLAGIFAALSFLHLFMFLYHQTGRANLFFSLFTFSVSLSFLSAFIIYGNTNPGVSLKARYVLSLLVMVSCISLSGFMNELFRKRKTLFYFIAGLGVLLLLLRAVNPRVFAIGTVSFIIGVSIEAFFIVIFSMFKKIPGTRIIGSGVLLFTLFILVVFAFVISAGGNLSVDANSPAGQAFVVFLVLAILSIPVSMSVYLAWNFSDINKNLAMQLQQVQVLSQKNMEQEKEKQRLLEGRKEELEKEVSERTAELRTEKEKSDMLLMNILPEEVATELKEKGTAAARHFDQVTVLFTDFKNFTLMSERLSAQELVNEINYCYSEFDKIITQHGIEKIKTIGDAYMCAGGLPVPTQTNATDTVNAALEILRFMLAEKKLRESRGQPFFEIRIGVHTGAVVAGIVGIKKFAYDIWGDTVNIASRMESSGVPGKVNISGTTYEMIKHQFNCTYRGKIPAKNKGEIDMYFVEG